MPKYFADPRDMALGASTDSFAPFKRRRQTAWPIIVFLYNLPPVIRFHLEFILSLGVIPGPNKPKNVDSFLFPGLHHLCAVQQEGLHIWDASEDRSFISKLFLGLNTADGPGMAYLNGLVGHHGKYGCRLYCPVPGRHKPNGPHYYPALLKPNDYVMRGCDHEDLSHFESLSVSSNWYFQNLRFLVASPNDTQYKKRRLHREKPDFPISANKPKVRIDKSY